MSRVTTCPYCKRTVGLVGMGQMARGEPEVLRQSRHAERDPIKGMRSDLCVLGTGLPVDPKETREEPEERRHDRASRNARQGRSDHARRETLG